MPLTPKQARSILAETFTVFNRERTARSPFVVTKSKPIRASTTYVSKEINIKSRKFSNTYLTEIYILTRLYFNPVRIHIVTNAKSIGYLKLHNYIERHAKDIRKVVGYASRRIMSNYKTVRNSRK